MPSSDLSTLYRTRPVTLWVEDEFTRAYLNQAWGGAPEITLAIAGSCSHMAPLVEDARKRFPGLPVYGLRDRDFGETNRVKWKPATMVFAPEVFESENWVLDPDVFANSPNVNTSKLTPDEIRLRLAEAARKMVSWLSCCATIRDIRLMLHEQFPADPRPEDILNAEKADDVHRGPRLVLEVRT